MVLNKRIQNAKKSTKCKVKYENMNNLSAKICGLYMCKCNVSMYFRNPFMNEYSVQTPNYYIDFFTFQLRIFIT